jgi:replicative DNA helicase
VSKWETISAVILELKQMSIRFNRPILITVQFNRNQKSDSRKELDLSDIAGSDSIPQDASIVLGARRGLPPYDSIRRQVVIMKNREGETGEFTTNFTFTPPNLTEIIGAEADVAEVGWMA